MEEAVDRGARKVYAAARDVSQLSDFVEPRPEQVSAVELDVTNRDQIESVAKEARDIQVLINNAAAFSYSGFIYKYDEAVARKEMETNYFGPLNLTRALADSIIENGNGSVVNVLSLSALSNFPPSATYSASKAAAYSMTQAVRAELGPQGVAVFSVYPGPVDTDMSADQKIEKVSPRYAAGRIFDRMQSGVEDITTEQFGDDFLRDFQADVKALERSQGKMAHRPRRRR